ncbi:DNA alkylation repair protein [Saccharothrix violaceirubra]|uniref:3-methyladenine DNA glycosylase AlkD n=1 Tax=Saccharothrix violaceirubra TaxID=413306 RepID=A0A7W7T0K7_9PSEU|nr:DNA alkylation repair protein [Saccharothrix violaceirubra]MBB4964374.1 3-methyladenine DNA glycosylase AlkD [Saccharothrix violaceirubra]
MEALTAAVRQALATAASPERAPAMQRYMKSEMPFLGVPKPERTRVLRPVFAAHPLASAEEWAAAVLDLWRTADHREERYAATALLDRYPKWRSPGLLTVLEELIVDGAWWDHVDEVASRHVGPLLLGWPDEIAPIMRAWSRDADRWRRRTSVICQLGAKTATDTDLLAECVEANAADKDFFLRKGIGWALRQYARTDPGWVRVFVDSHTLSPLSVREALKHV